MRRTFLRLLLALGLFACGPVVNDTDTAGSTSTTTGTASTSSTDGASSTGAPTSGSTTCEFVDADGKPFCPTTTSTGTSSNTGTSSSTTTEPECQPLPCEGGCPAAAVCAEALQVCVDPATGLAVCAPCRLVPCEDRACPAGASCVAVGGLMVCVDSATSQPLCLPCPCAVDADCSSRALSCSPGGQCVDEDGTVTCPGG